MPYAIFVIFYHQSTKRPLPNILILKTFAIVLQYHHKFMMVLQQCSKTEQYFFIPTYKYLPLSLSSLSHLLSLFSLNRTWLLSLTSLSRWSFFPGIGRGCGMVLVVSMVWSWQSGSFFALLLMGFCFWLLQVVDGLINGYGLLIGG